MQDALWYDGTQPPYKFIPLVPIKSYLFCYWYFVYLWMDAHLFFFFISEGKVLRQAGHPSTCLCLLVYSLKDQSHLKPVVCCFTNDQVLSILLSISEWRILLLDLFLVSCHLYLKPELLHHLCQVIVTVCWWEASQESHTILCCTSY